MKKYKCYFCKKRCFKKDWIHLTVKGQRKPKIVLKNCRQCGLMISQAFVDNANFLLDAVNSFIRETK